MQVSSLASASRVSRASSSGSGFGGVLLELDKAFFMRELRSRAASRFTASSSSGERVGRHRIELIADIFQRFQNFLSARAFHRPEVDDSSGAISLLNRAWQASAIKG